MSTPSDRRNVTVSMPAQTLRAAKVAAAQQGVSLSGLLVRAVERYLHGDREYQQAMTDELAALQEGFSLGSEGRAAWTREELHER